MIVKFGRSGSQQAVSCLMIGSYLRAQIVFPVRLWSYQAPLSLSWRASLEWLHSDTTALRVSENIRPGLLTSRDYTDISWLSQAGREG